MATGLSEVDMQSPCAVCGTEVPPVDGTSGVGKEVCPQGHSVGKGNTRGLGATPWYVALSGAQPITPCLFESVPVQGIETGETDLLKVVSAVMLCV